MIKRPPRLLIVDQSLRDAGGHHYEYDLALFRAAVEKGVPTLIGAHRSAVKLEHLGDAVRPWFQRAWYESYGPPPPLPVPAALSRHIAARGLRFLKRNARRLLGSAPPPPVPGLGGEILMLITRERFRVSDHVLVHTFSVPELDSLIELASERRKLPAIHIILRRDADETLSNLGARGGLRGSLSRLAESPSAMAALRLYADTAALAQQYEILAPGVRFDVMPIPHCLPAREVGHRREGPLRIVYLGDARDEKGFQFIPEVVEVVGRRFFADARVRFVLQANIGAAGDSSLLVAARDRLAAYPTAQVELISDQLSISAFHDLLWSADIVLLPYDREAYRRRSSGILIQALAAGRVVVVPAGTWMATQIDPEAGVTFDGPADLGNVLVTAVDRWPELSRRAQERAPIWCAEHNAALFIVRLLG